MPSQNLYLHIFNLLPSFTPRLEGLFNFFESPLAAFEASRSELLQAGLDEKVVDDFLKLRPTINLDEELSKLEKETIRLLSMYDTGYPSLLTEISHPPILLYYRGEMQVADELCVAVVGTRKITNYGRTVAPYLIEPLIQAGVTVVSGLAYGVDSQMQQLAINNKRRTIAILGGGIDEQSLYPKNHSLLADQIIENGGAIISEYPPGTPPLKHHFIARNRIISGMSIATVIIECNLKSGSLITAKYALEQNRSVYAVPGLIYAEMSSGPNNLIKMGAKLITNASDILDDLNIKMLPDQQQVQSTFGDTPVESELLKLLSFEPMNINDLIKQLEFDAGEITSALTFLEMKGKVRNLGAQQYVKSR